MNYKCDYCKKPIIINERQKRSFVNHYCSHLCANKGQNKKTKYECDYCGKIFLISKLRLRSHKNHYCNSVCQYAHRKVTPEVTPRFNKKIKVKSICVFCKKMFFTYPKYPNKYCSRQCWRTDTVRKNSVGNNEKIILDSVEKEVGIKIDRQVPLYKYVVDGYCRELNIVFEVDERSHFHKPRVIRDKERENKLKEVCKCHIIRLRDLGFGKYLLRESLSEGI